MARAKKTEAERTRASQIADIAERYPDNFVECRDIGHSWRTRNASWLQGGGIERVLGCIRCETTRIQILDKEGYVIAGHYDYADGYTIHGVGGLKAPDRAEFRRASVTRFMSK